MLGYRSPDKPAATERHMAEHEHGAVDADMDFAEHQKTFARFTGLVKWGCIGVAVLLILMAMFLVH